LEENTIHRPLVEKLCQEFHPRRVGAHAAGNASSGRDDEELAVGRMSWPFFAWTKTTHLPSGEMRGNEFLHNVLRGASHGYRAPPRHH